MNEVALKLKQLRQIARTAAMGKAISRLLTAVSESEAMLTVIDPPLNPPSRSVQMPTAY